MIGALLLTAFMGRFSGDGTSTMHKSGTVRPCSEIFLNISQSADEIRIAQNGYICEDLQASTDNYVLKIRDGRLIGEDGMDLGIVSDNVLDLRYKNAGDGWTYHWRLEQSANGREIEYLEEWIEGKVPALTVRGTIYKVQ